MVTYSLLADLEKCVGCQTCEVACKLANSVPVGPRPMRVITVGPVELNGKLRMSFFPMRCTHCGEPACIDVCPVDAITKRSDGIVVIDEASCTGCKLCIEACPLGAMQFDDEKNVVVKCSMCVERIEKGLKPMCVIHCPAEALHFGDINKLTELIRKRKAREMAFH
jgi:Fe-S-cluster-containing dehydrogenase component